MNKSFFGGILLGLSIGFGSRYIKKLDAVNLPGKDLNNLKNKGCACIYEILLELMKTSRAFLDKGIDKIQNHVTVHPANQKFLPELQRKTMEKVMSAITKDPRLKNLRIKVDSIGGVIHLTGEVSSIEEKAIAEDIVKEVTGAQLIVNECTLN
ncbi:MAG: BON domain-containing protein [Firmicutes bacterium]|nr:BON domain-containing protein [Bacillota bacterium]